MAVRGGQVKSVKALKNSMKRGGGSGGLKRVPADEPLTVRFLQEPEEWFEFFEHFDEVQKRFVVCTDNCDYCADDNRASKRALANVLLVDEGKVEPMAMPSTLVNRLLTKYDKYSTMLDRDYELIRTGKGLDTEYDVNPEDPKRRNLSRFEIQDLNEVLEALTPDDEDDEPVRPAKKKAAPVVDDDDEDEEEAPPRKATKRRAAPVAEEDDEDEDEDDEDEEFLKPRRTPGVKPKAKPTTRSAGQSAVRAKPKPSIKRRPGGLSK